jgi:serine/threonine protein kinase
MADAIHEPFGGTSRFELRRRLGAGAFGVVYEAYDRERASVVALKTLRRAGEEALYRFKQEFRSLADIVHPNLVALYELLSDGRQWFFTMELVEGKSFHEFVRRDNDLSDPATGAGSERLGSVDETRTVGSPLDGPSDPRIPTFSAPARDHRFHAQRLRPALSQAAAGIHALHAAGKLHRDVKSSNVLVTRSGRVVLLDFGLVTELDWEAGGDQSVAMAGTPVYMSPEQSRGCALSEASDWYSLGVMLYEALTGQAPFSGTFSEIMRDKQLREPRPPHEVVPDIPEDLDRFCCELLRRDPRRRPPEIEILQRLGLERPSAERPRRTTGEARGSPFVGRQSHLARLLESFHDTAERGRTVAVAVHGGSGMGKTALVRRFLDSLRSAEGAVILAGRCFERESVPYKALDNLMDVLSRHLKRLPQPRAEALMPRDVLALARLFPVLRRVEAVAGARRRVLEVQDLQELRRRAFGAFRELMGRLAEETPLVLFIDDLQWGDLDSAALLEELMRPPNPPPLLLIVAYRTEEASTSPLLRRLLPVRFGSEPWREIEVDRLDPSEARDLARALLSDAPGSPETMAELVARESSGNPFFLSELARSVRGGREPPAADPSAGTDLAVTLDRVIQSRVARLPEGARRFLEVVAVAGQPVEFAVANEAAAPGSGENVIEVLRIRHLIRTRETESRAEIETYHDRIREAIVSGLSPEELERHHRGLALALEASGRADPESLALHWKESQNFDRAAEYAVAAARRAAETLAFDRAARLYSLALDLSSGADPPERRALRVGLADALSNAGRGAEAASAYLVASRGAPAAEALELQRRAAEQFLISGHIEEGLSAIRSVLARVGLKLARTPWTALLSILFRRAMIRLRGIDFHERDATQVSPETLSRIDICCSVTIGLGFADPVRGADFQARHLFSALRAGEPYRVARALAIETLTSSQAGGRSSRRTKALFDAALSLAERIDNPHAIGLATFAGGFAALLQGRWETARELTRSAEAILRERCRGVAWELDNAHYYSLLSLYYLGRLKDLSESLPALLKEAQERGDLYATTNIRTRLSYLIILAQDHPEKAREELRDAIASWTHRGFFLQHWYERYGQVECALYVNEGRRAWTEVLNHWSLLKQSLFLRTTQSVRIFSRYLRARAALAAAAEESSLQARDELLRSAARDVRRIEREMMRWGKALAALLRSGIAAARGDPAIAVSLLDSAEKEFEAVDMLMHAAAARRRRGELIGGSEGQTLVETAERAMRDQKIQNPAAFAAMLAPGKWRI